MYKPAHNVIFASYSAPINAPAPSAERVVHSTVFSAYDAASSSVAPTSLSPAKVALLAHWHAWRAARKNAREERELWKLAKGDPRVMIELNCLMGRND